MKHIYTLIVFLLLSVSVLAAKKEAPLIRPIHLPYQIEHGLQNRHIALWGSHGMYYNAEQDRWMWQRARVWTTVEDLFTSSFTAPYLVPMLENAGAVVMQPRAYVRPGYQTVYVRWMEKQKKPLQTIYVQQGDNTQAFEINTAIGHGVWHYLCTVPKGDCLVIGAESMLVDEKTIGPSGYPRFMEAARYWVPYVGVPDSVWFKDSTYNDYLNDIIIRGGWVNYLCGGSSKRPKQRGVGIPLDMSIAVHTDAGVTMNDSLVGTMAIYTQKDDEGKKVFPNKQSRMLNAALADSVLQQLVGDLQKTYTQNWPLRELKQANYGETRIPQVPSMLIEMLSHQNYADMCYALNPEFRKTASRAIYKGIGRFLSAQNKSHFIPQPLEPKSLRTAIVNDSILLTWRAQIDSLEIEATPTYYIVYARVNNGMWNLGQRVDTTCYLVPAQKGNQYDFCVVAGNEGGISFRSTVVSASYAGDSLPPVLIVDAFDEVRGPQMMAFDSLTGGIVPGEEPIPDGLEMAYIGRQINYNRKDMWHSDDDCGFGQCTMHLQGQFLVGNTHDYAAIHGNVLRAIKRSYVSCTMDALSMGDSVYKSVDVVLGKSAPHVVRTMNNWISLLGWTDTLHHVLISGSYVGYPSNACASGCVRKDGSTFSFHQQLNSTHLSAENVSAVTKLSPTDTITARYSDTGLPAIVQNTTYTLVGFPLETMDDFSTMYQMLIR